MLKIKLRDMVITGKSRVGDIVKQNFKSAPLFEKNNIDFCCGGGISVEEACKKSNINEQELIAELNEVLQLKDADSVYIDSLEPDALCDYIEKRHHSYVRNTIPFLKVKLQKLCDVHGENHPELFDVKTLFYAAADNLSAHLEKEEGSLFPLIRQIQKSDGDHTKQALNKSDVFNTINSLLQEHQAEGDRFESISELTSGYVCPPDGCNTFRVTYQTLKEFADDLHRHVHLENNILFQKTLSLMDNTLVN